MGTRSRLHLSAEVGVLLEPGCFGSMLAFREAATFNVNLKIKTVSTQHCLNACTHTNRKDLIQKTSSQQWVFPKGNRFFK